MHPLIRQLIFTRKERGFSQRALAERMKVKHTIIGRIEAGEVSPTLKTLDRIANALGVEFQISPKGEIKT